MSVAFVFVHVHLQGGAMARVWVGGPGCPGFSNSN